MDTFQSAYEDPAGGIHDAPGKQPGPQPVLSNNNNLMITIKDEPMKQLLFLIGIIAISMVSRGQMVSMNMDGDDPALWERVFLDEDVGSYWSYDAEFTNLDSIIGHGINPEEPAEALGISWVQLTSDSLSVVWKTRKIMRRYFYLEFDVDSITYGDPSPIFGFEKTIFHLSGNDNWTPNATATFLHNKKWYRLYIRDDEVIYYFNGRM